MLFHLNHEGEMFHQCTDCVVVTVTEVKSLHCVQKITNLSQELGLSNQHWHQILRAKGQCIQ